MGLVPSIMGFPANMIGLGPGFPATLQNKVMDAAYDKLLPKDITSFEGFHEAVLDMFNILNSALPGDHYDMPSKAEVQHCYHNWKEATNPEKKQVLIQFLKRKVTLSKLDKYTLMTGLLTPPVAMAAKKAGESVPQLKLIKAVPDVLFVPSATVLALISAKISRKIYKTIPDPIVSHGSEESQENEAKKPRE